MPVARPDGGLVLPAEAVQFLLGELRHLQAVLACEHGHRIDEAGAAESVQQTANRQDFVDRLSAAVGVQAGPVEEARLPSTSHAVDHGEAMSRIDRLCEWLSMGT